MADKIEEFPAEDRPREKLERKGPQALTDSELLALVIGSGIKGKNVLTIAREIMVEFKSASANVPSTNKLTEYDGVGEVKAAQLVAAFELARRLSNEKPKRGEIIDSPDDVIEKLASEMRTLEREELRALHISNSNELLAEETLFRGSLDEMFVAPREVVKSSMKENSKAVILVHNHPNGSSEPSEPDIVTTKEVQMALSLVDVDLIDHMVIGSQTEVSLKQRGYI